VKIENALRLAAHHGPVKAYPDGLYLLGVGDNAAVSFHDEGGRVCRVAWFRRDPTGKVTCGRSRSLTAAVRKAR
jgi:hypothetical protein